MLIEWTSCYNSKLVWLLFVVVLLTTTLLAISLEREVWAHKTNYPRHLLLMLLYQSRKWGVMCWCIKRIDFVSFYNFDIWFLELFRQCGIFGIVPTVWYFRNCSDSVVFLELFQQCGIFFVFHFIVIKYLINLNMYFVILLWFCILI